MQNRLSIALLAVLLSACGATLPVTNTVIQKVEIPIAVPCKVDIPPKPQFNFDKLTIDMDIFDKTKSILADRELHIGYEVELLAALTSCIK